ncbi:MAG: hypothetical protein IJF47_00720 [Candidatus Methanomethylophilaceae archaeon]|nr:hypothetical protein [Candidatus Methanomethylophilaceae archaeon]
MDLQSINKPVHIAGYEIPFWNLLLIIGGAVAFISMFMNWIKIEISYWGYTVSESVNAFDLLTGDGLSFIKIFPFLIGIAGLLAAASVIVPMFVEGFDHIAVMVGAGVTVLAVLLGLWFLISGTGTGLYSDPSYVSGDMIKGAFGLYLGLLASIVAAVGGVMRFMENKGGLALPSSSDSDI